MFALYRTCAQDGQQTCLCQHVDEQRIFTGTWLSLQLDLALEMWYKVMKIHQVWHFQDKVNRLFRGYIDMFLKRDKKLPVGQGGVKQTRTKRGTFKSTKTMPAPERCGSNFTTICWGKLVNALTVRKPKSCRTAKSISTY